MLVPNALLIQSAGEPVVTVEIELQTEGGPSRDAKITQAEFLVDEIDIIVKASAGVVLEERSVRLLVVPGLENGTGFHGGEDVNDAGMVPSRGDDFLDALLLAQVLLANELDVDLVFCGEGLDVFVDLITHRRGPLLEVEDSHAMGIEKAGDGARMANVWQCALDDNPIEAAYRSGDLVRVTFGEVCHQGRLRKTMVILDHTWDLLFFQDLGLERSGGDSNEAKRRRIGRSATGLWGSSRKSR